MPHLTPAPHAASLLIVAALLLAACNPQTSSTPSGSSQSGVSSATGPQTVSASRFAPGPEARALLERARSLQKEGKAAEAIALLKTGFAAHPDEVEFHREYQDLLRNSGQTGPLRDEYDARLKAQPGSALAHYLFGRSIIAESPEEAEQSFRKALELDPTFLWGYMALGTLHSRRGDNFAAVQMYEAALKRFPDSPDLYFNLANASYDSEVLRNAIEAAEHAIKLRPDYAEAYEVAGKARFKQQDLDNARADLEKAVSLSPELGESHLLLAMIAQGKGESEKAKRHAAKAVQLGKTLPDELKPLVGAP